LAVVVDAWRIDLASVSPGIGFRGQVRPPPIFRLSPTPIFRLLSQHQADCLVTPCPHGKFTLYGRLPDQWNKVFVNRWA
jgi:hypothetical protein